MLFDKKYGKNATYLKKLLRHKWSCKCARVVVTRFDIFLCYCIHVVFQISQNLAVSMPNLIFLVLSVKSASTVMQCS